MKCDIEGRDVYLNAANHYLPYTSLEIFVNSLFLESFTGDDSSMGALTLIMDSLPPIRVILIQNVQYAALIKLETSFSTWYVSVLLRIIGEECPHVYWWLYG